jgi:hypothetical protein
LEAKCSSKSNWSNAGGGGSRRAGGKVAGCFDIFDIEKKKKRKSFWG